MSAAVGDGWYVELVCQQKVGESAEEHSAGLSKPSDSLYIEYAVQRLPVQAQPGQL